MVLEDEADAAIAEGGQLGLGKLERVLPVERDAAAAGRQERAEDAQQGALARAAGADHRQAFTIVGRQRDVAEHHQRLVPRGKLAPQVFD